MDDLKLAVALWPWPITLVCILILKNQSLDPIMETAIYFVIGVCIVVAAFVALTKRFADPGDQTQPD